MLFSTLIHGLDGPIRDMRGVFKRSEFTNAIAINNDGMRYHEVGPKSGYRVAVLGDSFTWGHGVEEAQRFTDLVEKQLASRC